MKKVFHFSAAAVLLAAVFLAGCAGAPQVVRADSSKKEAARQRMEKAAGEFDMTKQTAEEIDTKGGLQSNPAPAEKSAQAGKQPGTDKIAEKPPLFANSSAAISQAGDTEYAF